MVKTHNFLLCLKQIKKNEIHVENVGDEEKSSESENSKRSQVFRAVPFVCVKCSCCMRRILLYRCTAVMVGLMISLLSYIVFHTIETSKHRA